MDKLKSLALSRIIGILVLSVMIYIVIDNIYHYRQHKNANDTTEC